MMSSGPILVGSYDYTLVTLSVLISILASYAALDVAGRVTSAGGKIRLLWLGGGATGMGLGIWSMHYVGMLALQLPVPVLYDWPTVFLSLLTAIAASAVALFVASRQKMGLLREMIGSVLMGGGIAAMHYIGMAAMRLPAVCRYSPGLVAFSIFLAVAISYVAISLTFSLRKLSTSKRWRKPISALAMGLAIPTMHYTGMAAASFTPAPLSPQTLRHAVGISSLGIAGVVVVTLMVLGVILLTTRMDRRYSLQTMELKLSEERYRRIVETTFDAFTGLDSNGLIVEWNPKAETAFGFGRSEVIGTSAARMFALEEEGAAKEEHFLFLLSSLQSRKDKKPMRMKALHRDGHEFIVEVTVSSINLDAAGIFSVFIHDITEQVQTIDRLQFSITELEHLKSALDQHSIVARTNARGIITFANDKFCSISKYSRKELIGQDHRIINSGYHSKEFMKAMWQTIQSGKPWKGEIKNRAKDGTEYWVSTTIVPFCDSDGRPREYIAIRTDITALKEAEEELRRAKEMARQPTLS